MHIGFVGQVHEIVDQETIVALDAVIAAIERPFRMAAGPEVRDLVRIRQRRFSDPDPDEAVPLDHRKSVTQIERFTGSFLSGISAARPSLPTSRP